jgi:hypothetical protein
MAKFSLLIPSPFSRDSTSRRFLSKQNNSLNNLSPVPATFGIGLAMMSGQSLMALGKRPLARR